MKTENLSTLKIHRLTDEQYAREYEAGNLDNNALYLTPAKNLESVVYAFEDKLYKDNQQTQVVYPTTKVTAVIDDNDKGLDQLLAEINEELENKATESFVTNKISEARLEGSDVPVDLSGYATKDDLASSIKGAVSIKNDHEAHIGAGYANNTRYRLAVTTHGNLRIDSYNTEAETPKWENYYYIPKNEDIESIAATANAALPAAGGTFGTTWVKYHSPNSLDRDNNSISEGSVAFYTGDDTSAKGGAGIWLYGNDYNDNKKCGRFSLQVYDEANSKYRRLMGAPDGSLKWDDKDVITKEFLPQHYHNYSYFYVDGSAGNDNNPGSKDYPFKSIDKAFEKFNEGWVNLRIRIASPGTYTFTKRTFVGMALHIENTSGGEVILKQDDSTNGITAFYNSHINSVGISWHGKEWTDEHGNACTTDLYFEGCSTKLVGTAASYSKMSPRLLVYGGHIIAEYIQAAGLQLSYCAAKLKDITINAEDISNIGTQNNGANNFRGISALQSNICILEGDDGDASIKFVDNDKAILGETFHVDCSSIAFLGSCTFEGLKEGVKSCFYRSTIYCTDDIKSAIDNNAPISSTLCIWENETLDSANILTPKTIEQENYTINYCKAYCRNNIVDLHISVTVKETPATNWTTIAALPKGYYPPISIYKDVPLYNSTPGILRMRIDTYGNIQLRDGVATMSYPFHDTFVT